MDADHVCQTDAQGAIDKLLVLEKQARQVCFPARGYIKVISNFVWALEYRLGYYIQTPCGYCHDQQELRRLEPPQRPSTPSIEKTWTAQAGHDEDDPGGYGLFRRDT